MKPALLLTSRATTSGGYFSLRSKSQNSIITLNIELLMLLQSYLGNHGWRWFGSSDVWHFDYVGAGSKDVRALSVRAFQSLWNRYNPTRKIAVDGIYGPGTQQAILNSPARGRSEE